MPELRNPGKYAILLYIYVCNAYLYVYYIFLLESRARKNKGYVSIVQKLYLAPGKLLAEQTSTKYLLEFGKKAWRERRWKAHG